MGINNAKKRWSIHSFFLVTILASFFSHYSYGEPLVQAERKYIYLDEEQVAHLYIHTEGTALSFPVKPSKVILGKQKSFEIEYIENDLILAPARLNESTNLFVYVMGRRFTFHLLAAPKGDRIVIVKDRKDKQMRPSIHE